MAVKRGRLLPEVFFTYSRRFKSFETQKWKLKVPTPESMANAGWFCLGKVEAQCYYCLKTLVFDEGDDAWLEHQSHSASCPLVQAYPNIPDTKAFRMTDVLALEKGRLCMIMDRAAAEDIKEIEEMFQKTVSTLQVKAKKTGKNKKK